MERPIGPLEVVGVQLQGEGGLGEAAGRQVEVVQLVNVAQVHLLAVLLRPVEVEQVDGARHPLVAILVALGKKEKTREMVILCKNGGRSRKQVA